MAGSKLGSSFGGNLLLSVGSIAFALLLIAGVEAALRATGLGAEDAARASRLKYQQVYLPVLEPGVRSDGVPVLRTVDSRLPYQSIEREKRPGSLRVFTFGGSATAGLGYSPNVTFSRHLERLLVAAYPDRSIELVNLGIVALSSSQVKVLVEAACREYEPDLVIVYSGNNEFLEIHAEKYAEVHATWASSLQDALMGTNLYRLVNRAIRGAPRTPTLADRELSHDELRLTQNTIIREIEMRPEEIDEIVARYRANLEEMVDAARETQTPILLATVASNWKWRGREDLPEGWLDELLGGTAGSGRERHARAVSLLTEQLAAADERDRWELLFKRAVVQEGLGEYAAARDDYRAAMNEDPHLRRALDRMAEGVRQIGRERGVPVFDSIAFLADRADHGIVGFDEFYDYVHFTPRGAVLMGAGLFDALPGTGVLPPARGSVAEDYVARRLADLEAVEQDDLSVREWMGIGFDPGLIHDRDLWKYDRMIADLDARIEADPNDFRALVYRGNAHFFRPNGGGDAARAYLAALQLVDREPDVVANLDLLRSSGRETGLPEYASGSRSAPSTR